MATLSLKGVRKSFGAHEVLQGIDLDLDDGSFLVLLGPSGCGKSTLLSIIAGLESASSGDVRIGGRLVTDVHPKDRNIAMVFQSYALYPTMTVARNLGFGLEMRRVDRRTRQDMVQRVAALLQIDYLLDRKPGQLSGGQRQRVAMGRAIVRDPDLFLFDEPLSNLDTKLRVEMRTEIKRLHERLQTTIVYVTHDQVEAMTLGTKVAVMRRGMIEQFAEPQEIYDRPANSFVAEFVGSPTMNFIRGTLTVDAGLIGLAYGDSDVLWLPALAQNVSERIGKPILAGIRPEQLTLGGGGASSLSGRVDVVEPTGPHTLVVMKSGDTEIVARLGPRERVKPGDALTLAVETAAISLFDPSTGKRVP